jgi:hypothetical protein
MTFQQMINFVLNSRAKVLDLNGLLSCSVLRFCTKVVPYLAEVDGGPIRDFINCGFLTALDVLFNYFHNIKFCINDSLGLYSQFSGAQNEVWADPKRSVQLSAISFPIGQFLPRTCASL